MKLRILFAIVSLGVGLTVGVDNGAAREGVEDAFVLTRSEEKKESLTLRIGGGSAPLENVFKRVRGPFKEKTGIDLELVECGPVDAWSGLIKGDLDVALTDSTSMFKIKWREMLAIDDKDMELPKVKLSWHTIGADVTSIYTHPSVRLESLSPVEVKNIFTGKYTNWSIFGGPPMPIVVVLPQTDSGLIEDFNAGYLDGQEFTNRAVRVGTAVEAKAKVLETPGSISLGPLSMVEDQSVNAVSYPASRRQMSMIWKWEAWNGEAIKRLYNYILSEEGKKLILMGLKKKSDN